MYIVFDTETGGLESSAPVLSLAYAAYTDDHVLKFYDSEYFWPSDWSKVENAAIAVNGLHKDALASIMAAKYPSGTPPKFADAIKKLIQIARKENAPLYAYNANFDKRMIHANLETDLEPDLPNDFLSLDFKDVMEPARAALKTTSWLKLVDAYKRLTYYDSELIENAHDALADVYMTHAIIKALRLIED